MNPKRAHGFSLIELVVAMAIMAAALGALYRSAGTSVRIAQTAERQTAALLTARSLLAAHDAIPKGGLQESGETPDGLRWTFAAAPAPQEPRLAQQWPLYRVDVTVRWEAGENDAGLHLSSLRPEQSELPGAVKP